jgi:hypothetical protein|tara:strand:+ start:1736 stop:1990 length:255 start_codon:yes stop_codon:yes gene_type:complete
MKKIAETYAIINIADLPNIDFSQVGETSKNTIRKSLDESQFVLKWNTTPSFIADLTVIPVQILTHSEAVELMATEAWSEPIEIE